MELVEKASTIPAESSSNLAAADTSHKQERRAFAPELRVMLMAVDSCMNLIVS